MRSNFNEKLGKARGLLENEFYSEAVVDYGGILEHLIKEVYQETLNALDASAKNEILQSEKKIGKGKPITEFTLGQLIGLFSRARLFQKVAEYRKVEPRFFTPDVLNRINALYRFCKHDPSYSPAKWEASWVETATLNILDELGVRSKLLEIKPKPFERKILEHLRLVYTIIAEKSEYEYETDISDLVGPTRWNYTTVKLVGARIEDSKIVVKIELINSEIFEEDFDYVARGICNDIYEKIREADPAIKKTKLHFYLEDVESGQYFEEEYPQRFCCPRCKKEIEVVLPAACPHCSYLMSDRPTKSFEMFFGLPN